MEVNCESTEEDLRRDFINMLLSKLSNTIRDGIENSSFNEEKLRSYLCLSGTMFASSMHHLVDEGQYEMMMEIKDKIIL